MSTEILSQARTALGQKTLPRTSYGPFLMLEALPWLLLSTVMRGVSRQMLGAVALPVMLLAEYALFIAFLIASQRMIQLAGGVTSLGRLPFNEQSKLAWSVIWRTLVLSLLANLALLALGVNKFAAVLVWFGFDAIVFFWPGTWLPAWSALMATFAFLMTVDRGMDMAPKAIPAFREIARRWRYIIPACALIAIFLAGARILQQAVGELLQPVYGQLDSGPLRNVVYVAFVFVFSYARLWLAVIALTLAVRASYRETPR